LEEEKSSFSRRFGIWAGLIAVVISILSGGISIYDRVRPELEKKEQRIQDARQIIRQLNELSFRLSEIKFDRNRKERGGQTRVINAEIRNLVSNLEMLGDETTHELPPGDLIILSEHSLNLGKQRRSIELAKLATEKSNTDILRVDSAMHLSHALYANGGDQDLIRARAESEKALRLMQASKNPMRFDRMGKLLSHQAIMEAYAGECSASSAAIERLKRVLSSQSESVLKDYEELLVFEISQHSRC